MYLAVAWLLLQVVDTISPVIGLSIDVQRIVLSVLTIGFPVAVLLAWVLELTPDGVQKDRGGGADPSRARWFDKAVIVVLSLAVVYFLAEKVLFPDLGGQAKVGQSIAVLPLTNLSQDAANEPFALGIHDDLLTHLSRIRSVRTVSRTSVLQYRNTTKTIPEIARELDVATVLEGGVQRSGDRIRINVQLIDAATDQHLWAETYDRELTAANVFQIQSDISRMIANQLRATLTHDEERRLDAVPTNDLVALDAYFIGKQLLELRTRESLVAAAEHFERVVARDPDFALAWSGLADANMLLPEYSAFADRDVVAKRSMEAVARALALDPDLPYVSSSAAWSRLIHDYDWQGAEDTFRRALEIEPDNTNVLHWLSHTLSWQGRHEEAVQVARLAVAVEPFSKLMAMNLAYILVDASEFDEALSIADNLTLRDPDYSAMRRNHFLHELRAGRVNDGADSFVEYTGLIGGDVDAARAIAEMMEAFARSGQVGKVSDDLIARARLGTEDLSQVLAFVGDSEAALAALRVAIDERSGSRSVLSLGVNPAYDFFRDDPRFIAMLSEVGLSN